MDALKAGRLESTFELLQRTKAGDAEAVNELVGRYLPPVRRWSRARLPLYTRTLLDTDRFVHEMLLRAITHTGCFAPRHDGALFVYLREALLNRLRDAVDRRPTSRVVETILALFEIDVFSSLEAVIGPEMVGRYDAALTRLAPMDREAIVARVEMGCSYEEVAAVLGSSTARAARLAVTSALMGLVKEMSHEA